MKMKFKVIYAALIAATIVIQGCNPDSLTDLNKNPDRVSEVIPEYMFTGAILNTPQSNYGVIAQGMQYFSTYKEVPGVGDKFYSFNGTGAPFNYYTSKLNRLYQIQNALEENPTDNVNKIALCRILRVYHFHQLTDVAGDIPYFDAMKGENGNVKPKYDTQKSIYLDMFKELEEAAASLDGTKPTFGSADIFYGGDVNKWRKFANSLMLRLGMRLTKVDESIAKTWVEKAIAGGVISSDDDIAKISYSNVPGSLNEKIRGWINGNYNTQGGDNVEGGKYAATFINHMKETKDPRLAVMSLVWVKGADDSYSADTSMNTQRGMISASLNTRPLDFDSYSEPSLLILNEAAPIVIMAPAESYLLLAEAAIRGWYSGSAQEAYEKGVRAGMTQWALWPDRGSASGKISEAQIASYIKNNPFLSAGTFEQKLEQISVQKWVSMFGDDYEVFANWRRTGYPKLMPVNYPGNVTGGQMFRRFSIPLNENLTNKDNYLEALQRQGFSESTNDNLTTRVWWDKQ